jgi:hypothetical protein
MTACADLSCSEEPGDPRIAAADVGHHGATNTDSVDVG